MDNEDDRVTVLGRTTIGRIDALIGELDDLSAAWKRRVAVATRLERREMADPLPGLHDFLISVKGTKNSVQRILKARAATQPKILDEVDAVSKEERDNKDIAVIMGCGLSSHQEQWDAIKRTHGLLALRRRFSEKASKLGQTVDAVVENGIEWVKVSIVTEKKLIYQMAQEGWHPDDSTEDSDDSDDEHTGIGIVKITTQLVKAARSNRCNTRIPQVRLVLPNLTEGRVEAVDKLLNRIRNLGTSRNREGDVGILVDCANSAFLQTPIPRLDTVFANLFRDTNLDRLTPTLNLELTILLSLVSDIAHAHIEPKEWYSKQTQSHIEDEEHAPGVRLRHTYTALRGRRLECTQEVAREFHNVVDDLGTEDTKARAAIVLGHNDLQEDSNNPVDESRIDGNGVASACDEHKSERTSLVGELQKLSIYPVPDDLQLPIRVVSKDEFDHGEYMSLIEAGKLPPVAAQVWARLDRSYNRSCHLWGWVQDITTISANSLNTRLIDATVDAERTSALDVGPRLYLSSLAISLNTAKPCPTDKWNEIKDAKHERKEARTKEAKQMKAAGTWGPSLGVPVKWDEKQLRKQDTRRKGAADSSSVLQQSSSEEAL
ncbi:hypothetical protein VP1G_09912 [Cytospora mali]|uniref:DUF1308 domain-containing protein n=1 Tax=Cytospora mali TaxID=578113 RepID=A0A194VFY4_CYTMA|nr:hypothetical protein VP1G_09912 [Valsa mali var. pyri (nom. inval.)]